MNPREKMIARSKAPLKLEPVECEGWEDMYIRELNGAEYQDYGALNSDGLFTKQLAAYPLIIAMVVSKDRTPIFTKDDLADLKNLPSHEVIAVANQCLEVNPIAGGDAKKNSSSQK